MSCLYSLKLAEVGKAELRFSEAIQENLCHISEAFLRVIAIPASNHSLKSPSLNFDIVHDSAIVLALPYSLQGHILCSFKALDYRLYLQVLSASTTLVN